MNTSIELKLSNGQPIKAELISFFELTNVGKKYVFYTLNEPVEGGLVKMYVSAIGNDHVLIDEMTDEEWTNIKNIMKSILTNNIDPNVNYIEWEE